MGVMVKCPQTFVNTVYKTELKSKRSDLYVITAKKQSKTMSDKSLWHDGVAMKTFLESSATKMLQEGTRSFSLPLQPFHHFGLFLSCYVPFPSHSVLSLKISRSRMGVTHCLGSHF